MCGRIVIHLNPRALGGFAVAVHDGMDDPGPRYNVAPSQMLPVVRVGKDGTREIVNLRWGLIPSWTNDPAIGYSLINARAETVTSKPAYRDAFRARRCLVLASKFYEWQRVIGARRRRPFVIELRSGETMAMAGLWESWQPPVGGPAIETCTIITTEANALVGEIHSRMPVILPPERFDAWLDRTTPPKALLSMLEPSPADEMASYRVSSRVNDPRYDDARCLEPAPPEDEQALLI